MIEIVSKERCVSCDICIKVCPMDVFDRGADGIPVISRQVDCQTCFLCEAYCPTDALYVAPYDHPAPPDSNQRDEAAQAASGALGAYREVLGWGRGRRAGSRLDQNHIFGRNSPGGVRP